MEIKALLGERAASLVQDGMVVGLGTGSTANAFIDALGRRVAEGLEVRAVASSVQSWIRAKRAGIPLVGLEMVDRLDLYVDGADEVAPDLTLLKGRGIDLVVEKLFAQSAGRFLVLVDESKEVGRLGERFPVPVEVWPPAWSWVRRRLEALGASPELRTGASGATVVTAQGNLVLDTRFPETLSPEELDQLLNGMAGVVAHGIFYRLADEVWIGRQDGAIDIREKR